ncbi:hypothetical protein D4T97_005180 [Siminovitchia acidinfaciens]|uniref:YjcQ protein n=1 Tax=Siminovitchia acidinfaciens TaxID=2321395 RepID=A0A429Y488_9BACI|nr:YjcQ family protein [Siminovitchia acidinfaciens]RST76177.1 hypothetical protein D4T97_005180 [Siminovitchia acidinfaciens]
MNKKKLRYAILEEIYNGNKALTEDDFAVTADQFDNAVRFLNRENYLKGIFYADDRPRLFEGTAYLSECGEKYLEENSSLAKTYRGLKEIRNWLKL